MRRIDKDREPTEWEEYRHRDGATFDADGAKEAKQKLRDALIREQGYLCAYCQRRITLNGNTRIEHIISQSVLKGEQGDKQPDKPSDEWWFRDRDKYYGLFNELYYGNLVLCCDGNISGSNSGSQNPHNFHCDRSKGERCVHFNIFSQDFIDTLSYEPASARIKSNNSEYHNEINDVLNLNLPMICRNRQEVVNGIKIILKKKGWNKNNLLRLLNKFESVGLNGYREPYDGFASWYLRRALRQAK